MEFILIVFESACSPFLAVVGVAVAVGLGTVIIGGPFLMWYGLKIQLLQAYETDTAFWVIVCSVIILAIVIGFLSFNGSILSCVLRLLILITVIGLIFCGFFYESFLPTDLSDVFARLFIFGNLSVIPYAISHVVSGICYG